MSESLKYLENFWVPEIGSSVVVGGISGSITAFASEDETQILLNGDAGKVFFIQDASWVPKEEDIFSLFKRLGFVDCGDSWYVDKVFYPKTSDVESASKTLMQARARRLESSKKDFVFV